MSQSQSQEPTVDTIADADLWQTVVDGVNGLSSITESVFEFGPAGFRTTTKDAANVALIRQNIDPDAFDIYEVDDTFESGINTERFDDLLAAIDDVPVDFGWDWEAYKWSFTADDVDYEMAGITPDGVKGSPADVPDVDDDKPFVIDVTMPVDKFDRASQIVEMNTTVATFRMGGDDGTFIIEGHGDDDAGTVRVHESDAFAWNEDPPEDAVVCRQSNDYISEVVDLLDKDTVRFVSGPEMPYFIWTTRNDVVDTKIVQAPRIDTR